MPLIKTKGINLKSIKVGEADKIVRLLSREHGKISFIAKGARRPTSKFGGRLELFAFNEYLIATGKSLYILSQAETIENFYSLREDPEKLSAASFILRLVDASTAEGQINHQLFDILTQTLSALKNGTDPVTTKIYFELRLMDAEGFFPHLDGCVRCKRQITKEPKTVSFNSYLGGLTCTACTKKTAWGISVPYDQIKLMKNLSSFSFDTLKNAPVAPKDAEKLDSILKPHISEHIGKDITNW